MAGDNEAGNLKGKRLFAGSDRDHALWVFRLHRRLTGPTDSGNSEGAAYGPPLAFAPRPGRRWPGWMASMRPPSARPEHPVSRLRCDVSYHSSDYGAS